MELSAHHAMYGHTPFGIHAVSPRELAFLFPEAGTHDAGFLQAEHGNGTYSYPQVAKVLKVLREYKSKFPAESHSKND